MKGLLLEKTAIIIMIIPIKKNTNQRRRGYDDFME